MTVTKTAELTGHGNPIFTLELSQKPGILFTGGNDKGVVEWSLENYAFIKSVVPGYGVDIRYSLPGGLPLLICRFEEWRRDGF